MSHATVQWLGSQLAAQEEVILGVLDFMPRSSAKDIAEALTMAQDYIHPKDRISTPVSGQTAGQYLGLLHTRGLVVCDPPSGVLARGRRIWWPKEAIT